MKVLLALALILLSTLDLHAYSSCRKIFAFPKEVSNELMLLQEVIYDSQSLSHSDPPKHRFEGEATLDSVQKAMYATGLLIKNQQLDSLGDKLIMGRLLQSILGSKADIYYARSVEITDSLIYTEIP
ncbi:MAG: hypothetical protein MJK18_04935 [Bdellovibrionales bacterium]|nr:hypothetical protein [Bdellovibrionales bacterium]